MAKRGQTPIAEERRLYGFLERMDTPEADGTVSTLAMRRTNFVFDAIDERSFIEGDFRPENPRAMPLVRVSTTEGNFRRRSGLEDNLLQEGGWYRLQCVSRPGGAYVWTAIADDGQAFRPELSGALAEITYLPDGEGPAPTEISTTQSWNAGRKLRDTYNIPAKAENRRKAITAVKRALRGQSQIFVEAVDVGQGSFVSIHNGTRTLIFFDVGEPLWFNAASMPRQGVRFRKPIPGAVVILSHWDYDHYSRAFRDEDLRNLVWIAPGGSVGPRAKKFADGLGRLYALPYKTSFTASLIRLFWGKGTDRNNSGIIVRVNANGRWILLTGDASYEWIAFHMKRKLNGLIVPHHAAQSSHPPHVKIPKPVASCKPAKAVACSGHHNKYKHPSMAVLAEHANRGWHVCITGRVNTYPGRGNKLI